jgi:hypothetical protein
MLRIMVDGTKMRAFGGTSPIHSDLGPKEPV